MSTLILLPDGTITGLYSESFDLSLLGELQIERATAIEFDNRLQVWRVYDACGDCLFVSPSRQSCLEWERKHLNWQLENA